MVFLLFFFAQILPAGTISCVKVFDCTEATSRDRLCADNFHLIFSFLPSLTHALVSDTSLASTTVASTSGQKHGSRLFYFSVFPQLAPSVVSLVSQEGHKCALACVAVYVEHQSPITSLFLHPRYPFFYFCFCYRFLHSDMRRDVLQRVQIAEF